MLPAETGQPPRQRSVVFIGFMGSGKTRVGELVADALGYAFVDTDEVIEQRAGRCISEIFSEDGEEAFRRLETESISIVLSGELPSDDGSGLAVSVGGGAATRPENWDILHSADALTIYLQAEPETLLERVYGRPHRPLLAGLTREQTLERITSMLHERDSWYRHADLVIPSDNTDTRFDMATRVTSIILPHLSGSEE
jgi:shikimate kinase / 3-dehydroquinate synthase